MIYTPKSKGDLDHVRSYFELGMVYGKRKEFKNEEKALKQVLQINPNHAPTYFYMGMTSKNIGCYDVAMISYIKAMKIERIPRNLFQDASIFLCRP